MRDSNRILIIAEVGINHNGSITKAKKMIDIAKKSGADYVKFQIFRPLSLAIEKAKLANYQKKNSKTDNQVQLLNKYKLNFSDFKELYKYAKTRKIKFLATAFEEESLKFLDTLKVDYIKVSSGEINNLPFLKLIKKTKKNILLSTGASTTKDVANALNILNKKKVTLLHCNSAYPSPISDLNLNSIKFLMNKFKCSVGYSDHSSSIYTPLVAIGNGAKIIEKHFTLDKKLKGPDHKASLNPKELKQMIKLIRVFEKSVGKYQKSISKSESQNLLFIRKSIVAKKKIIKGEKFSKKNLTCKRPGNGISPMLWERLMGKKSKKNYKVNEQI
tara:strand:+ start:963 stop:1952 length:990 start_codon:yes stop_codon:yes gene_type:complete